MAKKKGKTKGDLQCVVTSLDGKQVLKYIFRKSGSIKKIKNKGMAFSYVHEEDAMRLVLPSDIRQAIERIAQQEDLTKTGTIILLLTEALTRRAEQGEK